MSALKSQLEKDSKNRELVDACKVPSMKSMLCSR
jgi:hypothetical protein